MGTVEFEIKGLAACYRKERDEFWNVVFPTDENHKVRFSWKKGVKEYGPINIADKNITISSADTESPSTYEDANFIKYVADLTSDYLHSDGLIKQPVLTGTQVCQLKIPHAMLTSKNLRDNRLNYVFSFDQPETIRLVKDKDDPSKPQIFSKLVGGSISLRPGGIITIKIDTGITIDLTENDSFYIDNDCHGQSVRNDFQLYQDIFINKSILAKRFEMISIFDPNYSSTMKTNSDPKIKIVTDPPPLICDTVRISKPNDLD